MSAPEDPDEGMGEAPERSRGRRARRGRVPGRLVRAVRRSLGLSQGELREPLRVGQASIARYEQGDAPAWMEYALIGVGVLDRGVPVDEMVRRVAAEGDAVTGGSSAQP